MKTVRSKLWKRFTLFFLGALVGMTGWATVEHAAQAHSVAVITTPSQVRTASNEVSLPGFAPVVKRVLPAVVNISSSKVIRTSGAGPWSPFLNDPFFRRFFGDEFERQFHGPRSEREQSLGSGVIISRDGYILTNNHVVADATEVKVALADKREMKARIVGTDPKTDIAFLKVDAKDLPALPLGDSSKVQVGDIVLAIGNPFGLGDTVTMGIVSATGRGNLGIEDYEDFIQTDAAINPGNSGGALINTNGELIGINTAIISGSGGNQGIGFAIPSNMALQVVQEIEKHGRVVRGWLGVGIQEVTPAIAKAFGLTDTTGVLIREVSPDSPASRAGLQQGDVILELNGAQVTDPHTLSLQVAQLAPGSTAHLKIFRQGSVKDVSVALGEMAAETNGKTQANSYESALGGVSVEELRPDIKQSLQIPADTQGVVVSSVDPSSPAAAVGLRRGDVIQEVNRRSVRNVGEFDRAVRAIGRNPVLLLIDRGGTNFYIVVEPA